MTDRFAEPPFGRNLQGLQLNQAPGNMQINNFAAEVPLADDLRDLADFSTPAAYELFASRSDRRKVQLLAGSDNAPEMFRRFHERQGLDSSVRLLSYLQARRIHFLVRGLQAGPQSMILDRIARSLASQRSISDARAHLAEWAAFAPAVAARLLVQVSGFPPSAAARTGLDGAIDLMPEGPAFLLTLPPRIGAALLERLLPWNRATAAAASAMETLLGHLVMSDSPRTARMVAELKPSAIAWYLRRLRFRAAVMLMMHLSAIAPPAQRQAVLDALPRLWRSALLAGAAGPSPGAAEPSYPTCRQRPPSLSAWPWIDAVLTFFLYAGPAMSRILHRSPGLVAGVRREATDFRLLCRAAVHTARDRDYFRRQRNHVAILAMLSIALVIVAALVC
ncbi:hypothetical protein AB0M36_06205 [Actinoplanes sp. NPDC051346]|uniref:hypothetical protein n=1 Tax=Actinoplanes sp. NPDC051346 TaxID=3155048 RepID=UPI00342F48EE